MTETALTDDVWTTAAADESATAANDETSGDDDHEYPQTKQALCERAEAHATDVAAEHFPELSVESITWETSTRMHRSAGVAIYDRQSTEITIASRGMPTRRTAGSSLPEVHHELIHAWQYHEYGEADHGPTFRQWIEPLETDRHCEQYPVCNSQKESVLYVTLSVRSKLNAGNTNRCISSITSSIYQRYRQRLCRNKEKPSVDYMIHAMILRISLNPGKPSYDYRLIAIKTNRDWAKNTSRFSPCSILITYLTK